MHNRELHRFLSTDIYMHHSFGKEIPAYWNLGKYTGKVLYCSHNDVIFLSFQKGIRLAQIIHIE